MPDKCPKCKSNCNVDEDSILCDGCEKWYHLRCTALDKATFCKISGNSSINWICDNCQGKNSTVRPLQRSNGNHGGNSILERITSQLDMLSGDIKCIKADVHAIKEDMRLLGNRVTVVEESIVKLDSRVVDLETRAITVSDQIVGINKALQDDRETIEIGKRSCNLTINGLPSQIINNLSEVVDKIIIWCGVNVDVNTNSVARNSMFSCFRTGSPNKHGARAVLVKFANKNLRDNVLFGYLQKRDLKLADVDPSFSISSRLYINEHLTPVSSNILKKCKFLKTGSHISQCFSRDGLIFIRRDRKDKPSRVSMSSLADLYSQMGLEFNSN